MLSSIVFDTEMKFNRSRWKKEKTTTTTMKTAQAGKIINELMSSNEHEN